MFLFNIQRIKEFFKLHVNILQNYKSSTIILVLNVQEKLDDCLTFHVISTQNKTTLNFKGRKTSSNQTVAIKL